MKMTLKMKMMGCIDVLSCNVRGELDLWFWNVTSGSSSSSISIKEIYLSYFTSSFVPALIYLGRCCCVYYLWSELTITLWEVES